METTQGLLDRLERIKHTAISGVTWIAVDRRVKLSEIGRAVGKIGAQMVSDQRGYPVVRPAAGGPVSLWSAAVIQAAAHELESAADEIRRGQTVQGEWIFAEDSDRLAKDEHDYLRGLAEKLRLLA